jgi:hypothetical protein
MIPKPTQALHGLKAKGWAAASWELSDKRKLPRAVGLILNRADEEAR